MKPGFALPWAGAFFNPGTRPFSPMNLSSKKELAFSAKGDGQTYRIMVFTQGGGFTAATQTFVATPDWKESVFKLSDFDGTDGHDLLGVGFFAGPGQGKFQLQLDDVQLR